MSVFSDGNRRDSASILHIESIQKVIGKAIATDAWRAEEEMRAHKVHTYREYVDGDHNFDWMSDEQRALLGISEGEEFTLNHCDNIVSTFSDRLIVSGIEGDNDEATAWAQELLDWNEFEALQLDVHDSAPRDGNTFVMVSYDNDEGRVVLSHEPAFDGYEGVMVIYRKTGDDTPYCAIKVWNETAEVENGDYRTGVIRHRLNVYYEDRIEKFAQTGSETRYAYFWEEGEAYAVDGDRQYIAWLTPNGDPIGVPIVPFKNKKKGKGSHGISVLENVVPIQNATNRTVHSLIASEDLSAFQIRYILGMEAPDKIQPGTFLEFVPRDKDGNVVKPGADTAEWLKAIRIGAIEQGEITPHLESMKTLKNAMYEISGTPNYSDASPDASGEALKQREVRLLGRVRRAQMHLGNAWKTVMWLAQRVQAAFGSSAPESKFWRVRWEDAQVRNDTEVITNAKEVREDVPLEELYRLYASVFGWDEEKIKKMVKDKAQDRQNQLAALNGLAGNTPPTFENFNGGLNGSGAAT